MIEVLYVGDTIIIEQSATHGIVHYLDKDQTRQWPLSWNDLLNWYAEAIGNDTGGRFYDDQFKEVIENELKEAEAIQDKKEDIGKDSVDYSITEAMHEDRSMLVLIDINNGEAIQSIGRGISSQIKVSMLLSSLQQELIDVPHELSLVLLNELIENIIKGEI